MEKWYLYVLRYNYSGHYYVGDTEKLVKRMLTHLRCMSKLPNASWANHSRKGFKYYWFAIDSDNICRRKADFCENTFTDLIDGKIKELKNNDINSKIEIRGGYTAKNPYFSINTVEKNTLEDDKIHKEVNTFLKSTNKLKTKTGEYTISLLGVGTVGEFQNKDCHKKWCEMRSVEVTKPKYC